MAGHKIFVSYKYWDSDVQSLPGYGKTICRDYVTEFERLVAGTDDIFNGEHDGEDLSGLNEETIWYHLRNRIYDSSVTIVFISPNMRDKDVPDYDQWIPWEISYSLRKTTRNNFTTHSNAVLAVVLPDNHNKYDYYDSLNKFKILSENIKCGYIPVVKWDLFKYNSDYYIEKAYKAQKETPRYKIKISL